MHDRLKPFVDALFEAVKGYVARSLATIAKRVDDMDTRLKSLPPPRDGKDADPEQIAALVKAAVDAIPRPKDGKDADQDAIERAARDAAAAAVAALPKPADGKSVTVADVEPLIAAQVANAVGALPAPVPGKDADPEVTRELVERAVAAAVRAIPPAPAGKDADPDLMRREILKAVAAIPAPKDGASAEEVAALVIPALDGLFAKWALEAERRFNDQAARALAAIPKPKDGVDGFNLEDFELEHDGERTVTLRFVRGDRIKEKSIEFPIVIDRGVYRDEHTYAKSDGATWAGSFWIAQRATSSKPGTDDSWRLAVKCGREGKRGRDGKDLTPSQPVKLSS